MKIPKLYRAFYMVLKDVDTPTYAYGGYSQYLSDHIVKVRRVRVGNALGWKLQFIPPNNDHITFNKNHYLTDFCINAFDDEDDYCVCGYLDIDSIEILKSLENYGGNVINFYGTI